MSKKCKVLSQPKPSVLITKPLPKEPLNKELITLAYIVTVVVVLNISLHNNNYHSIHKELCCFCLLILSYTPVNKLVYKQLWRYESLQYIASLVTKMLYGVILIFLAPTVIDLAAVPGTLSAIPLAVTALLLNYYPSADIPLPPTKGVHPVDVRNCADVLFANLSSRLRWVMVNLLGYSYLAVHIPFHFSQKNTQVTQNGWWKTQIISCFIQIGVLLCLQALPTAFIQRLSLTAEPLGRWHCAVITNTVDTLPEWSGAQSWSQESIVRHEDKVYIATNGVVCAHPANNQHTLFHMLFGCTNRVPKILALTEATLIIIQFYQMLSLRVWQQFLPASILILWNIFTMTTIVKDARQISLPTYGHD